MRTCIQPGLLTLDELIAAADGEEVPGATDHLRHCQACALAVGQHLRLEQVLLDRLYRIDCPPSQTLSDFELGLLPAEARRAVGHHLVTCQRCREELQTLRQFMTTELVAAPSGADRLLQRLVATLMPAADQPAMVGALRGERVAVAQRYHCFDYELELQHGHAQAASSGFVSGSVWHTSGELVGLIGSTVQLLAIDGTLRQTAIDDIGGFSFDRLPAMRYQLQIELMAHLIVVEDLVISG